MVPKRMKKSKKVSQMFTLPEVSKRSIKVLKRFKNVTKESRNFKKVKELSMKTIFARLMAMVDQSLA